MSHFQIISSHLSGENIGYVILIEFISNLTKCCHNILETFLE